MRWRDIPPLSRDPENPSTPDKSENEKTQSKHYLNSLLLSGYYTLTVPMRVTLDSDSNEYVAKEWGVQKYLCSVLWILSTVNRVSVLRRTFTSTLLTHTIASYFQLTHAILHIIVYVIYYLTISKSSCSIVKVLNSLQSSPPLHHSSRNRLVRLAMITSQKIWTLLSVAAVALGYELLNSRCWSPETFVHATVIHGRHTFFTWTEISSEDMVHTGVDTVLGLAQVLVTASNVMLLFFIVCLFGTYATTLWADASEFCDAVLTELSADNDDVERDDGGKIMERYEEAVTVSSLLNSTFQCLAFWYLLDLISWLSTELVSGLRTPDYFAKIHIFYYLTYIGTSLFFSAEAFRKIEHLKCILSTRVREKYTPKTNKDLDHLLKCLQTQFFGIGETGFFKLNYPFIGQITSLVVTFYIISINETKVNLDKLGNMNSSGECYLT